MRKKYFELSLLSEYLPHTQFLPVHQNGKHGLYGLLHFVGFYQISIAISFPLVLISALLFFFLLPLFTLEDSHT